VEIPELTVKLIILLLPGALSTKIYKRLTLHKHWSDFDFVVNSIVFGGASYIVLQFIYNALAIVKNIRGGNEEYIVLNTWQRITDKALVPYDEVAYASVIGIFLGYIFSAIDRNKIINRIAHWMRASDKYGDEGLYSYFLNSREIQLIYLRYPKNNLTYHGFVISFAEEGASSEILLANVSVYSYNESELLYEIENVYLAFEKSEVIIEKAKTKNGTETQTSSSELQQSSPSTD
jgi:hypothetical protein